MTRCYSLFNLLCALPLFIVFSVTSSSKPFPPLNALKPQVTGKVQAVAVTNLLKRLLPKHHGQISIQITDQRTLEEGKVTVSPGRSTGSGPRVHIVGNSGTAAAYGLQRYLRSCCNAHFSWDGFQLDGLQNVSLLPIPVEEHTYNSAARLQYFGNICTYSYSLPWWRWDKWEWFIDWLALSGFNLILAPIGQEYIWKQVYLEFGMTEAQVDEHFAGPAFLAWARMGNLKHWAGPLSKEWLEGQRDLQFNITRRLKSLGMVPALPTFPGHVPNAIKTLYPESNFTHMGCWGSWNATYSCLEFLDPTDALFQKIADSFMIKQKNLYGLSHAYAADAFNEMLPPRMDTEYLGKVSNAIYNGAAKTDPDAIWYRERVRAFLTGVPAGKILVLDLRSEEWPKYENFSSYFGQPFVWNMLHNFGGTNELRGSFPAINEGMTNGIHFNGSTFVGTGLTMEGLFQNYVIYQFLIDRTWSSSRLDPADWIVEYAASRYGSSNPYTAAAWTLLFFSVYKAPHSPNPMLLSTAEVANNQRRLNMGWFESNLFERPKLGSLKPQKLWYNAQILCQAWSLLMKQRDTFKNVQLFRHDLIDITREVLQTITTQRIMPAILKGYSESGLTEMNDNVGRFTKTLQDLDHILGYDPEFSLLSWINGARAKGLSKADKDLFDFNARNQITLWGPGVHNPGVDYARKQWSGMIKYYYLPRWTLFFSYMEKSVEQQKPISMNTFESDVYTKIEKPFATIKVDVGAKAPFEDVISDLFKNYISECRQLP